MSTPASQPPPEVDWPTLLRSAGPYPLDAYRFVRAGLQYTVERVHAENAGMPDADRHVSGQQLCLGLRDFAIDQYGMLAPSVLGAWNVHRTEDFGRMVFAMIEHGVMSKTQQDSLEDFRLVYDFDEAFSRDKLIAHVGRV